MADISFDEDQQSGRGAPLYSQKKSFFVRLALGTGLVKTDKGAQYLLLGTAIVLIVIALGLVLIYGRAAQGTAFAASTERVCC